MWQRGANARGAAETVSDQEKYVGGRPVTFLRHGLPGSLLVLPGLLVDWCCHDLHLHKKPAFEKPGPGRSTGRSRVVQNKMRTSTHEKRLTQEDPGDLKVCSCIIPQCLQRAAQRLLHQLFHTRNPSFIVLHLLLQGLVYAEYTLEIFGYCQELEFYLPYLLLPYLLLGVNLVFFTLTCSANPGIINKTNESFFLQVYRFDDVMFPENSRCFTCGLRKPARSKHCRVCDHCVHRFDHHCIWVNNCIGAWNTRYFLIYLLTLAASAATIAILSAAFLVQLVAVSDLYQETYIDDFGHLQSVDTVFLIQYLFLAFPRIIFLLGFVMVLSLLLAGYLCFLLYLAATNQTTNEWYKGDWTWCQNCPMVTWSPSAEPHICQNIHSHGFWSNLREIFLPAIPCYEKKKK